MDSAEVQAQRAAANQPPTNFTSLETPDFTVNQVREQVAKMTSDEVNRELLAQLYAQNKELKTIKGHLLFQTIMYLLGIFGAIAIYDTLSRLN